MTETSNYQLNQWEKTDRILMEDFNADNAKVDAALKAIREAGFQIISGSFEGTGDVGVREYSIGVKPKLLFVRTDNYNSSYTHSKGLLIIDILCIAFNSAGSASMQEPGIPGALTDNGFTINTTNATLGLNTAGSTLYYWAIY